MFRHSQCHPKSLALFWAEFLMFIPTRKVRKITEDDVTLKHNFKN